jgi:hypothetical protein
MRRANRSDASRQDVHNLIERAARQGVALDRASAEILASLDGRVARRKLEGVCRLIKAARSQNMKIDFGHAMQWVDACGGNPEEAIRRMKTDGSPARAGIGEFVEYAGDQGIALAPRTVRAFFKKHGRPGARCYIDKLGAIMDAASFLGIECTLALARRRLSSAQGDARRVIFDFAAAQRRWMDRRTAKCCVPIAPRSRTARANALAGCGCPRCQSRLAIHLRRYIAKMVSLSFFAGLDRQEAIAEANSVLIEAIETWPGGNFTGWFASRFEYRTLEIYRATSAAERETVSLDAPGVLADDQEGHIVSLGELIFDRTKDVLTIVIAHEDLAERALELRRLLVERCEEYDDGQLAVLESLPR